MSEFWKERKHEPGWTYYDGPNGLRLNVREDGGGMIIRYSCSIAHEIIGIGATEQKAIEDWLHDAMEDAEETERELDALHEAIAALRQMKEEQ